MTPKSVTRSYKAGIIGCGRIGCGSLNDPLRRPTWTHAGSYMAVDGVNLVTLCDCQEGLAHQHAKELGVLFAYTDYRDMLTHSLDIVSICTPPETHPQILHDVAKYDSVKAIYCEKPLAKCCSAAESMVQVCDERGILLMVNHQRRFGLLHQEIARIVRDGDLGRIQQVTCYYGGGVYNSGSHLIDLLRFYLGEMTVVWGQYSPTSSHKPKDPNIDGWLTTHADGTPISIQTCDPTAYVIFEINILGTKGRLRTMSSGRQAELEHAETSRLITGPKELSAPTPLPYTTSKHWIPRGIQHLLDCLGTGEQPISSGRDGVAALKIIEALITSAEYTGG